MTTWVLVSLVAGVAGYAWGVSGLLPIFSRELFTRILGEAIPKVVAAHPFAKPRIQPWRFIGLSLTWLTFGSILVAVVLLLAFVGFLVLTPLTIVRMIHNWFRLPSDGSPPPRLTPAGIVQLFTRKREDRNEPFTQRTRGKRFRYRATV